VSASMSMLLTTLQHIKTRPGMYFGGGDRSRSIHILKAFITGFNLAQQAPGGTGDLDFFTEWVATQYRVLAEGRDSFHMILEHVAGDEQRAFEEFYALLPGFLHDLQDIGTEG